MTKSMQAKLLHIAPDLALPLDAVTATLVVYGGKGMGKTNFASVLVEEFAVNHLRFAVIDPMGVWWGLRHDVDGRGAGIEAVIFGGIHGDLPIEPSAGADVADFVADEDASVIIDISRRRDGSMWSIGERVRFVTAYAKRLYQRQGERRRPIHQVIDEAARFAPQIVRHGESDVAACMGAIAVLVEEGRNVGIGVTLVTQRSARLSKDVAELADCVVAFRIVGPNSTRAVLDWLGEHVDKARLKDFGEQIRSLPRGSALVVSPGWLEYEGICAIRKRRTFDSSKTPEAGKEVRASGAGAKPDLAKYRERFAKAIEDAKANDPKALKARVAELEKRLAKPAAAAPAAEAKVVEKPVITDAQLARIDKLVVAGDAIADKAADAARKIADELKQLRAAVASVKQADLFAGRPAPPAPRPAAAPAASHPSPRRQPAGLPRDVSPLPPGEALTLTALIQYPAGLQRSQIRTIAGYKRSSSDSYLARLRERGFVAPLSGDRIAATDDGRRALPDVEPLPSGKDLQDWWLTRLKGGERVVLEYLLGKGPQPVERTAIDEATGYQRSSRDSYLSRLAARELVTDAGRGCVSASPVLFGVV